MLTSLKTTASLPPLPFLITIQSPTQSYQILGSLVQYCNRAAYIELYTRDHFNLNDHFTIIDGINPQTELADEEVDNFGTDVESGLMPFMS